MKQFVMPAADRLSNVDQFTHTCFITLLHMRGQPRTFFFYVSQRSQITLRYWCIRGLCYRNFGCYWKTNIFGFLPKNL